MLTDTINPPSINHPRILVVGDVMLDRYFFGDVERISPEAPVPVVRITRVEERPGGAANVARNIAEMKGKCSILGVVGQDESGRTVQDLLSAEGIDTFLFAEVTIATTVKLRVLSMNQQMIRLDFEEFPTPQWIVFRENTFANIMNSHDLVVLSDYAKGALKDCQALISAACNAGKQVLVDPKATDFLRYRGAYLVTPNVAEFRDLVGPWTNESELTYLAEKCREHFAFSALLITRGEEGMTLFDAQGRLHIPSQAREVFDVSGAGDTVIATIAVMLVEGAALRDAVTVANAAAGIAVSKLGTATVSRDELFGG